MADSKISALPASTTPLAGTEVLPVVQSGATKKVSVADLTAGRAVATSGLTNTGSADMGGSATNIASGGYVTRISGMSITDGANWYGSYGGAILNANTQYTGGARRWGIFSGVNATNFGIAHSASATADPVLGGTGGTMSAGTLDFEIDTSGNIKFNVGNLIQGTAAKGVNFTANTPAAGMTSQLLNWYEEGTWTPVLYSGATDATMNAATAGRYTRIGRVVHIHLYIHASNLNGIGGGTLAIKGLPFTVNSGYAGYAAATVGYAGNLAITAGQSVALRPNAGDTTLGVLIWNATTGTADMTGTEWTNTGYVGASFSYMI